MIATIFGCIMVGLYGAIGIHIAIKLIVSYSAHGSDKIRTKLAIMIISLSLWPIMALIYLWLKNR